MNIEEVRKQLTDLEIEYKKQVRKLKIEYARTLIKYTKGQTISDHHQTIKIDSISLAFSYGSDGFPEPIYLGPLLTKTNKLFKNGNRGKVYQSNIQKLH
jgi:hypothetical protein